MNPGEVEQYLSSFINHEHNLNKISSSDFKLERVISLLEFAGNPQKSLRIIHIAGSKGKGSTAAITANILKCAGYKVGLYSSPHIENYKERIRILDLNEEFKTSGLFDDQIEEEKLSFLLKHLRPLVEEVSLKGLGAVTFYELFTVVAFCYFRDQKTDFVVLETGLGGRLDATNVADSLIAAITSISLEHTNLLGNTLQKIAYEKACIIKETTQQVVISKQPNEAMQVILDQCKGKEIQPIIGGKDVVCKVKTQDKNGQVFDVRSQYYQLEDVFLPLLGEYQLTNVEVSIGIIDALKTLGFDISKEAVYEGVKTVCWPCRFEIVKGESLVVLDAAHNEESIKELIKTCRSIYPGKNPVVVVGLSNDKNKEAIIKELGQLASLMIVTKANHPRSYNFSKEEVKEILSEQNFELVQSVSDAYQLAKEKVKDDEYILITGSVFIVSEARKLCIS